MKYIDAEKLFNEIKIIQQSLESRDVSFNQVKKIRTECLIEFCKCITDVIDSLQHQQQDGFIEKACEWLKDNIYHRVYECGDRLGFPTAEFINEFKNHMKNE